MPLLPALTVIVPPGRIPRLASDVPGVRIVVPVRDAGEGGVAVLDVVAVFDDAVEELDDELVELPDAPVALSSTCWTMLLI